MEAIDIPQTWSSLLMFLLTVYEDGSPAGRKEALGELQRMAAAADAAVNAADKKEIVDGLE